MFEDFLGNLTKEIFRDPLALIGQAVSEKKMFEYYGEGRMRLNVVSTKLISTKRRPLDVNENSLLLLAVSLPQAIKCLKKC